MDGSKRVVINEPTIVFPRLDGGQLRVTLKPGERREVDLGYEVIIVERSQVH